MGCSLETDMSWGYKQQRNITHSRGQTVHHTAVLFLSDRGWAEGFLSGNEHAAAHVTVVEELLLVLLITSTPLTTDLVIEQAQSSQGARHMVTFGLARAMLFGVGLCMSGLIGWIILSLFNHDKDTPNLACNTHKH